MEFTLPLGGRYCISTHPLYDSRLVQGLSSLLALSRSCLPLPVPRVFSSSNFAGWPEFKLMQSRRYTSRLLSMFLVVAFLLSARHGTAQEQIPTPGPSLTSPRSNPEPVPALVAGVRVIGNKRVPTSRVRSFLKTRTDRGFDPETVQADVRELIKSGLFRDVKTFTEPSAGGVLITFQVFELPIIGHLHFVGNRKITDRTLKKHAGLEIGEPLSPFRVNDARQKIEEHYRANGYPKTQVSVFEGNRPGDEGVIFVVHEDELLRIWHVDFKGNKLATNGRLKTQIKSKPAFLKYFFGGKVDFRQVDEDVQRLTAYYRNLGYFNAKIGRELRFHPSGKWLTLVFVINEGPQYYVRNVSVIGNQRFLKEDLESKLVLRSGDTFNAEKMQRDRNSLLDIYGSKGHIFADIKADPRLGDQPGWLDLVYSIAEGEQYRVGRINIRIAGEYPHTKQSVVLNRISLRPGDIIDIREIRASQRRLIASQLFVNEPARGVTPELTVVPPDLQKAAGSLAKQNGGRTTQYRGQSPEPSRLLDLNLFLKPRFPAWWQRN